MKNTVKLFTAVMRNIAIIAIVAVFMIACGNVPESSSTSADAVPVSAAPESNESQNQPAGSENRAAPDTPAVNRITVDPTRWTAAATSAIFGSPTERPSTFTPNSVHSVVYGNGRFVVVGDRGKIAHSADGITWTAVNNTTFGSIDILAIAYGGGRFVAGGREGRMAHSTDGITWTAADASIFATGYASLTSITFGNGRFIAGKSNVTCAACNPNMGYSTDGITWMGVTNNAFARNDRTIGIFDIAYGDNKFIATSGVSSGASPGSGRSLITQSVNGTNWTEVNEAAVRSVFGAGPIYTIAYGGGYFVATGAEMGDDESPYKGIGYSTDGLTWTAIDSSAFTDNDFVRGTAYGNGRLVMVGDSYTRVGNHHLRTWFGRIWYSETVTEN